MAGEVADGDEPVLLDFGSNLFPLLSLYLAKGQFANEPADLMHELSELEVVNYLLVGRVLTFLVECKEGVYLSFEGNCRIHILLMVTPPFVLETDLLG